MDNKKKNSSLITTIFILFFFFGGALIPLVIIGLFFYLMFKKGNTESFSSESKYDTYKNIGKPKTNSGFQIKPVENKGNYDNRYKNNDFMIQERKRDVDSMMIQTTQTSSNYISSSFKTLDDYSRLIRGMNPQELLELIDAFYDEFTHSIYHEGSNTAHITSGVALIHNATKNKWYSINSTDLLHKTKKMFDGSVKNELYREYQEGDTIWIKLLPLHGSPYTSLYSMERDVVSKYSAKKL